MASMKDMMVGLNQKELNTLFPFHLIINEDLVLESAGESIIKLFPSIGFNSPFFDYWDITRPRLEQANKESFKEIISKLVSFHHKSKPNLPFKGHFELISSINKYIFFGTPAFSDTSQLIENKLSINDFALNNSLIDLLHVLKNNEIVNSELKELLDRINMQKNELLLFKNIINSSSDAIYVSFENGDLFYINKVASEKLGIPMKDAINYNVQDFQDFFQISPNAWGDYLSQIKTNIYLSIESINVNQTTKEQFPVEVTAKYVIDNDRGMIVAISRDISERKQNERTLRLQEEKYMNIISNMNLGLLEVDNNDIVKFCNQGFEKISGFSLAELKDKKARELFVAPRSLDLVEEKEMVRLSGESDSYEIEVFNKTGEKKWWLISGAPHYNDEGEIIGSIGIHLDITEQKKLTYELEKAMTISKEASEAKELFLANMSHEIRTPLNGIIGIIRALNKESLSKKQKIYLNSAQKASLHLLSVVNNILDISKIEAGELKLYSSHFSMEELLTDVVSILKPQAEEKKISLLVNIGHDVSNAFIGDEVRIRQFLINLAGNSLKFTNEGKVTINCTVEQKSIEVQEIKFVIKDTGVGMDDDFLEHLFVKFQQEDSSISRKFDGTGLGLFITKELLDIMDGTIKVESKKGEGTEIQVSLPLRIGSTEMIQKKEFLIQNTANIAPKVLLVEDNELNRLVVSNSLQLINAELTEAKNGIEAIELLKQKSYDVILMDIQMPIMNGLEATKIIRKELKIKTPIIALSANAFKSNIETCIALGMNDYVTKPFEEEDLIHAVVKHSSNSIVRRKKEKESSLKTFDPTKHFDLKKLKEISRGDDGFVIKMLDLFIKVTPEYIKQLDDFYATKNIEDINKLAHKMKPSIDNMDIASIRHEIRELENFSMEGSLVQLRELIEKVTTVLKETIEQLKNHPLLK
jgi:PAS domain S-box-containing protein